MKKKKVLLVTLQSVNIGNRLQNYALKQTLEKVGCEVIVPTYVLPGEEEQTVRYQIKYLLAMIGVSRYREIKWQKKRKANFHKFNRIYIGKQPRISFGSVKKKKWDQYDYAVTGSDQVWHRWSADPNELDYFYLMFMPIKKRISYAASFGFSEFPKADWVIHERGLKEMNCLSCREHEGADLILKKTGRKAQVLADPVFLLEKEQWMQIEKEPEKKPKDCYCFWYFLGQKPDCNNLEKKQTDQQIVSVFDKTQKEYYAIGPQEFVWLLHHAENVYTDSFHACAFALLFQKEFTVFRRCEYGMEDMFGRIESLLKNFGLWEEAFSNARSIHISKEKLADTANALKPMREQAYQYLMKSLGNLQDRRK